MYSTYFKGDSKGDQPAAADGLKGLHLSKGYKSTNKQSRMLDMWHEVCARVPVRVWVEGGGMIRLHMVDSQAEAN